MEQHPPTEERVKVLLPIQGLSALDYKKGNLTLHPGDFVQVPLGPRVVTGIVWENAPTPKTDTEKVNPGKAGTGKTRVGKAVAPDKLKLVHERIDLPPLSKDGQRFIRWMAEYYLTTPNTLLRMTLSVPGAFAPPPEKLLYCASGHIPPKMTTKRQSVLDNLPNTTALGVKEIATRAGVTDGVVRALIKEGILSAISQPLDAPYCTPNPDHPGPELSSEQQEAANSLTQAVKARNYQCLVLEGVTGSGKTEVYFEAIAQALRNEQTQVLILVPEIALTSQWLGRFEARFGAPPTLWHSDLGMAERRRAWRAIVKGEARVVVGARSALFLPYQFLNLIIVDEEHDPSYKQEDGLCYNARDMAVVRAHLGGFPIVLASATPSLETVRNVAQGRYHPVKLTARHGGASLPSLHAIDMRRSRLPANRWLSPELVTALGQTMGRGEQALLFLNRRGYAPLTLCRTCGERLQCPNCSSWLVEHRLASRLQCHHCGHAEPIPNACPGCEDTRSLVACGPGVERLGEEVRAEFPGARVMELTSDTLTSPQKSAQAITAIQNGDVDIIVGTQLVTKGYHFPNLTCVGVVDADLGLAGGDLRAAERSFQQLTQVAGRAGRAERPGQVFIQTHMPENPVMQALLSGDQDAFMAREADARRLHHMPPFGRLAALIISGVNERDVLHIARSMARAAPKAQGVIVFGPAPAPLALLRGRYRYRLLLKTERQINIQRYLKDWLTATPRQKDVRIALDIDPYSFM